MDLIDPNSLTAEAISAKGAALTSVYNSQTFAHDWTEGVGTLPTSGEIDIPAPATGKKRLWLYVQNQSTQTLPVRYEARLVDGLTQSFATVLLGPGASTGTQGASDERGFAAFMPQGIVKIGNSALSQLASQPVAILEVVE